MKSLTIVFIFSLMSFAHAHDVSISYSKPTVTVVINGKTVLKQRYDIQPSYSKEAEVLLQSMQLVYVVGQCIVINNDRELPSEPHTPTKGSAIIYNLNGAITQKLSAPLRGKFISPLSNKWAVSINNIEGDFNGYTMLSSQCLVTKQQLATNYKVYDGYQEFYNSDSIMLVAPEAYPSETKKPVNILINEQGFRVE